MDLPLVSVIMPVYNASEFIRASVESILDQSYSDIELILINDGSSDNSLEILKSYNDKRIKLINNESNKGLIDSLNEGISHSSGKYIARMDADDISHFNRIKKQVELLEKNQEADIVATHTNGTKKTLYHTRYLNSEEIRSRLLFDNIFPHPTVMFRKDLFDRTGIRYNKEFLHAEDYAMWLALFETAKYALIPEPLLQYREHGGQVSKLNRETQKCSVLKAQLKIFDRMGITITHAEADLHKRIFYIDYIYNYDFLIAVEKWLKKLKSANEKSNFFSRVDFNHILSWVWFEICTDFLSKKIKVDDFFVGSALYAPKIYSKYYLLKYKIKNILL